jgi:hypothetical protein
LRSSNARKGRLGRSAIGHDVVARPVSIAFFGVSLLGCSESSHAPPGPDEDYDVHANSCHGTAQICWECGVACTCPGCFKTVGSACLGTPSCTLRLPDGGSVPGPRNVPGGQCIGGLRSCSDVATSQDCAAYGGCNWTTGPGCDGTPTPCDQLTNQSDCSSQRGCWWL